jgi:YD repeat-containing protein
MISTKWFTDYSLPEEVAEPLRITKYTYGGATDPAPGNRGNVLEKRVRATTDADGSLGIQPEQPTDPKRVWTYEYWPNGRVKKVDGPREAPDPVDETNYTYYADNASCPTTNGGHATGCRGELQTVSNALKHATTVNAYNAHGQPVAVTDPNGLLSIMTYDARQRLLSRTVGDLTTSYEYDAVGQITKVTQPDSSFLTYQYDEVRRLRRIDDSLGNYIVYTPEPKGNGMKEEVKDSANTLVQKKTRLYDSLNRLVQELGAEATPQTTTYAYDKQSNLTSIQDPLQHVTTRQPYDALNRLTQVTDPGSGVTQYAYDGLDALVQVTDPRSLVTTYTINGLGNLVSLVSPDTGTTLSAYDTAGNLLTQTDARAKVTSYLPYDALNRVTSISFGDGLKTEYAQAYAYDQGTYGIGRLSSITETNAASQQISLIQYAYDQHGRVTSETRTVGGVAYITGYVYDGFGRLSGVTYPSGRTVTYTLDALGRVVKVATVKQGQAEAIVARDVQYHPFGVPKSYTLGIGQGYSRTVDLDGRIASYTLGGSNQAITYDAASRITRISQICSAAPAPCYGYDDLDRLTSAVLPSTRFDYTYDGTGNRTSKAVGGGSPEAYTYTSGTNRIATVGARTFAFDASGSTTSDGINTYRYDARGRMDRATNAQALQTDYQVNALGQRVRKTNTQADTVFHYDTGGRLLAETDAAGAIRREYIYLGDIPIAVIRP